MSDELSTTHVATSRRSSSVAWTPSGARRRPAGRPAPRAAPGAALSGASTTITAPYSMPRFDSTSSGTSCTTIPSGGAAATWRRNSSPIAGCVIASSCLRVSSVTNARAASAARSSAPSGRRISGPNASTSAASAGVPGSTTSRAIASASTMTAPRSTSIRATVDLPDPIPPVSPTMSTGRVYEPAPRTGRALRIRWPLPTRRVKPDVNGPAMPPGGAHCGPTQTTRRVRPPGGRAGLERRGRAPDRVPPGPAHGHDPLGDDPAPASSSALLRHSGDHFWLAAIGARRVRRRSRPSTRSHPTPYDRASGCSSCSSSCSPSRRARSPAVSPARSCSRRSPGCCSPGTCGAGGRRSAPRSRASIAAGGHDHRCSRSTPPTSGPPARSRSCSCCAARSARFTRNLIAEIESHQAAAIDQAAEMATANELLVSLHALAQTLPASFDLREVVDSMRAPAAVGRALQRRWWCSCATTRSRCGPSSSPRASGSPRT